MTRTLAASIVLGLALASVGCSERQLRRGHDRVAGRDREDRVDINRASERELRRLPGISDEDAERIVANRPYPDKQALVRRGVIGPRKFDRIEDWVYAGDTGRRRYRDDDDRDHRRYYDDDWR